MNWGRPRLAFISPVFLFPNDAGGKIRSTNILRGLMGGRFDVTLVSPASEAQVGRWRTELEGVCDDFVAWRPQSPRARWTRVMDMLSSLPVNVAADRTAAGRAAVRAVCERQDIDLAVFDFVHAAVLAPECLVKPAVCFTHNVEAEIFQRHAGQARDPLRRWLWSSQHRKMLRFESCVLKSFRRVIAVSERDAQFFRRNYGVAEVEAIPTGVDLDYFSWSEPPGADGAHQPTVAFTGSMDWEANVDGVRFFINEIWPLVLERVPAARFVVVGRNPPAPLVALAHRARGIEFTGFVDDVRPEMRRAHVFVIPLRVGGGTRIKAFEAMAMGCPVISTAIGIEGLSVEPDEHFLLRDEPGAFAESVVSLLGDAATRSVLSRSARALVERRFGHREVARHFEAICYRALLQAADDQLLRP